MSATKAKRKHRNRAQRYTSNVFAMFSQEQIQEFKEAFNVIDQNRDGFVDKDDLLEMLTSLGKNPTDEFLEGMIQEAPGPLNFTMFLTLFGEKLNGTDPEDVIRNAFGCFDPDQLGVLPEEYLKELMTTMGDRWSEEQVEELFIGAPIKNGLFDYRQFTRALKHGSEKDEDPQGCPNQPPPPLQNQPPPAHNPPTELPTSSDKPKVQTPKSRRKSLTKEPPKVERSLEEEFVMRKFSLAASMASTTDKPPRRLSVPSIPKDGIQPPPGRKFSVAPVPQQNELDNPFAKTGLKAIQDLKTKPKEIPKKDIKPMQKDTKTELKPALKSVPKSALKKS